MEILVETALNNIMRNKSKMVTAETEYRFRSTKSIVSLSPCFALRLSWHYYMNGLPDFLIDKQGCRLYHQQ